MARWRALAVLAGYEPGSLFVETVETDLHQGLASVRPKYPELAAGLCRLVEELHAPTVAGYLCVPPDWA